MIFFQNSRSSLLRLLFNLKINKLSPSLHYLSVTSSLLRLSLPPVLHTILYDCFPAFGGLAVQYRLLLFRTKPCIAFLSPLPRMPCSQQSSLLLHSIRKYKRNYLLSTSLPLSRLNRRFNLFSSAILTYKNLSPRFYLSFTTKKVSVRCSISWFANYS